jgi:hypothetical protein
LIIEAGNLPLSRAHAALKRRLPCFKNHGGSGIALRDRTKRVVETGKVEQIAKRRLVGCLLLPVFFAGIADQRIELILSRANQVVSRR